MFLRSFHVPLPALQTAAGWYENIANPYFRIPGGLTVYKPSNRRIISPIRDIEGQLRWVTNPSPSSTPIPSHTCHRIVESGSQPDRNCVLINRWVLATHPGDRIEVAHVLSSRLEHCSPSPGPLLPHGERKGSESRHTGIQRWWKWGNSPLSRTFHLPYPLIGRQYLSNQLLRREALTYCPLTTGYQSSA